MKISRPLRTAGVVAVLLGGAIAVGSTPAAAHDHPTDHHDHGDVTVHVGQSIQPALDAAAPGATVTVEPGAYRENLVISKAVHLIGDGVVLLRPATDAPGPCTDPGGTVGICITPPPPADPNAAPDRLTGVSITGIRVTGASYDGIVAIFTDGVMVKHTLLDHNGGAGVAIIDGTHAVVEDNELGDNAGPGVVLAGSSHAAAQINHNLSYNNAAGILIEGSTGAEIEWNDIWGNCIGVAVATHGQPGGSGDAHITRNLIADNNRTCDGSDLTGIGVLLSGAHGTTVNENVINGHHTGAGTAAADGSGVAVRDNTPTGGGAPSNDVVTDNRLTDNTTDLNWDGAGTGIDLSDNHCRISTPAGLCTALVDDGDDTR